MGKRATLGGNGRVYVGDDIDVIVEVLDPDTGDPVDVSGWASLFVVSRTPTSAALVSVAGSVGGVYDADRTTNTQRITYALTDVHTATLTAGDYVYSARRTTDGSERVLASGPFLVDRANQI
jgi:hypothetical protein